MKDLDEKKDFLEFGKIFGVTKACKKYGYSRESYYRLKRLYDIGGEIAIRSKSGQRNKSLGENAQKIEKIVVELTIKNPHRGHQWIARKIKSMGFHISSFRVWYIWEKYNLEKRNYRFDALLAKYNQGGIHEEDIESDIILQLVSNLKNRSYPTIRSGLVLSPGDLGAIDILTIRENEEKGHLYQLTFIDWYSNLAIAKIYDKEIESVNIKYFLMDIVSRELSKYYVSVDQVLTNKSYIYRSAELKNSFKNLIDDNFGHRTIDEIDKCTTFHHSVMDDFYIKNFRLKSYRGLENLQKDLNNWISEYNRSPCKRNYCYGKSPVEVLNSLEDFLWEKSLGI